MNMRAKIGQLVRFRAGGPVLTVAYEQLEDDGTYSYTCQWFEYESLRTSTFAIAALEPVEGEFFKVVIEEDLCTEEEEAEAEAEAKRNPGKDYH